MLRLREFAEKTEAAPYLTKLHISTIKANAREYPIELDLPGIVPIPPHLMMQPLPRITESSIQGDQPNNHYLEHTYGENLAMDTAFRGALENLKWLEEICVVTGERV